MVLLRKESIISKLYLVNLNRGLRLMKVQPDLIDMVELNQKLFLASYNGSLAKLSSLKISNEATCGISRNRDLSILKSLVEFVERKAVFENNCESSNGFAAFPVFLSKKKSRQYARVYSYFEAVERYVWRRWWEDPSIAFEKVKISPSNLDLLFEIRKLLPVLDAFVLLPKYDGGFYKSVVGIACIETQEGVILGGAARANYEDTEFKALSEALIHSIAMSRYQKNQISISDYERRLIFLFENKALFFERIKVYGSQTMNIGSPVVDQEIEHRLDAFCSVHRMLFSFEKNLDSNPQVGYI